MTAEQATIISAIIQAVATIAIGLFVFFAGLYFGQRQAKRRNKIEYEISATALADASKMKNSPLSISIDKEFLTGVQTDKGTSVPINYAMAFFVQLTNSGNEAIEKPVFEVRLDEKATIVQYETEPKSRSGYKVEMERDATALNLLRVTPEYINGKDTFSIILLSVENNSPTCDVNVFGRDIKLTKKIIGDNPLTSRLIILNIVLAIILGIFVNWLSNFLTIK